MGGSERDKRVEELFRLAVELRRSEREGFYRRHCADDPELRAELEALLTQDDEGTKDFLTSPVLTGDGPPTRPGSGEASPLTALPERIGRYRLIEKIGEGGMGAVFLAEQESPLRREVALKIVKLGMDTEKVVARFERERQALALMDHVGIARIFDGGTTETGRPYFVMEHVEGLPIHEYCNRHELAVEERLELFVRVCAAVQHAHQKGIIHRDIKPTNVLVAERDGRPEPKIIDFGIARAVSRGDDETRQTRPTEVVGTSDYMSPEQADLAGANVDTRADIYSLGVLLYELLTGVLPFDKRSLRGRGPAELQAFLRHADPPPPSARLARLDEPTPAVAGGGPQAKRALARRLAGDLDWIALKAIAREPERRYQTASELAAEIQRFLADEPVFAGPPDWTYKVGKFVRRHRVGVLAGSLAILSLVAGVIGTTYGMLRADRKAEEARQSAEAAQQSAAAAREKEDLALAAGERADLERENAEAALGVAREERARADDARRTAEELRAVAEAEAREARTLTGFLVETLALADPEVARNPDATLRDMLYGAGERVESTRLSPEGEATLRAAIGQAFHSLGELELAQVHLERALEIQQGLDEVAPDEVYATMLRLSKVYEESDSREARGLGLRASFLAAQLVGESHPELGGDLAFLLETSQRYDLATQDQRLRELVQCLELELPPHDPLWLVVADAFQFIGDHLGYQFGESGALPFLEAALAIRTEQLPPTDPAIAKTSGALIRLLNETGDPERALELVDDSIAIYSAAFPEGHPWLLEARSFRGECLSLMGEAAAAERLLFDSHEALLAARGPENRATIDATYRLVRHYAAERRPEEAERYRALLAQGLAFGLNTTWRWDRWQAVLGPGYPELSEALKRFHDLQDERGELSGEAYLHRFAGLVDEILERRRRELPDDDPLSILVARVLADYTRPVLDRQAVELHARLCGEVLDVLGPHRARLTRTVPRICKERGEVALLGADLRGWEDGLRAALEIEREVYGRLSQEGIVTERVLLVCLYRQGRLEEMAPELEQTWRGCVDAFGPAHSLSGRALANLVALHDLSGDSAGVEPFLRVHLDARRSRDTDAGRLDAYAWSAVRSPGFSDELYQRALATAERGVETAPDAWSLWNTYGAALYRVGRHEEALEALVRAGELRGARPELDDAVRTMALHALGRSEEARRALGEAHGQLADRQIPSPEAQRLVAEAQALLASG